MGYWSERRYRIKANKHFPNLIELPIRGVMNMCHPILGNDEGNYERLMLATIDPSCAYQLDPTTDGLQWNKLGGLTTMFGIHKNSARFAWRVNEDVLEIASYTYHNGERFVSSPIFRRKFTSDSNPAKILLGICATSEEIIFGIADFETGAMTISLFDEGIDALAMYRANVFFGGKTPAPHNMEIIIEELDEDFSSVFKVPKEYLYRI